MYTNFNKRNAIKEVQKYLTVIMNTHVSQNGIYDSNTKETVKIFQQEKGLEQSGIVDRATHAALYNEYNRKRRNSHNIVLPIFFGSYGENMKKINRHIKTALDYYGFYHNLKSSAYYSIETEKSVEILRQIYNLDKSNGIDDLFYFRLINDIENF